MNIDLLIVATLKSNWPWRFPMKASAYLMIGALTASISAAADAQDSESWQDQFAIADCTLTVTGQSRYFVLEPGFRILLESDHTKVQITVLDETKTVDGILTRVVEKREWGNGKLYEVARKYFAMCERTKDVFYFGEDIDFFRNGRVFKRYGMWLAGRNNARAGLIMPGDPKVGMKYYQEIAPGVAMDRAEVVEIDGVCKTPAGTFSECLRIKEGTALDPDEAEFKFYAPGIGLISDEDLRLTKYGFVVRGKPV